jgi:hypothetical protein
VGQGGQVALATPGSLGVYVGNWTVDGPASSTVTIEAAALAAEPVLQGAEPTAPVFTVLSRGRVRIVGLTIRGSHVQGNGGAIANLGGAVVSISGSTFAHDSASGSGGAIFNTHAGVVDVVGCRFANDSANSDGGAIDNADTSAGTVFVSASQFAADTARRDGGGIDSGDGGPNTVPADGLLEVSASAFVEDAAAHGGAIDSADGAHGTLTVSGSVFSHDTATQQGGDGGAIDSADSNGDGSDRVLSSTFVGNSANLGGAIDNADEEGYGWPGPPGTGSLYISRSVFQGNSAGGGGAVDNAFGGGNGGTGKATISQSSFDANSAGDGGAIDNAEDDGWPQVPIEDQPDAYSTSYGTLGITASTFSGNTADFDGGAIDNGQPGCPEEGTCGVTEATLVSRGSTFWGNSVETPTGDAAAVGGGNGGAIDNYDNADLSTSTFWGNTATLMGGAPGNTPSLPDNGAGGAIDNAGGTLRIWRSTLAGNKAQAGPAIDNQAKAWAAADIFDGACKQHGVWHDSGYNLDSGDSCSLGPGDLDYGPRLVLTAPADHGGTTPTVLVASGTPLTLPAGATVSLGGSNAIRLCRGADQRGMAIRAGKPCLAGAVQGVAWYAYASGRARASARACPPIGTASSECTLAEALTRARPGDAVALATPGRVKAYVGNWDLSAAGEAPVVLGPAPGATDPVLYGNNGRQAGCATAHCDGAVLRVGPRTDVEIYGTTIEGADNTRTTTGGAVAVEAGARLALVSSLLADDSAALGGAVGTTGAGSTVSVSGSTLASDNAVRGGAVAMSGHGVLEVSSSTLSADSARAGGAISDLGAGVLEISTSTFWHDSAAAGASVDNEHGGDLVVTASTFAGDLPNTASDIDSGGSAPGSTTWAAGDIFAGRCQRGAGPWHDLGYNIAAGTTCLRGADGDVDSGSSLPRLLSGLGPHGGPTKTAMLLLGNPAVRDIPLGSAVVLDGVPQVLCPTSDQRGTPSTANLSCDAGAVQGPMPGVANGGVAWFAYARGRAPRSATSCPRTTVVARQCTLGQALASARPGDAVDLATVGTVAHYVGNWEVEVTGQSNTPLVIQAAPGTTWPILDGNHGRAEGCSTKTCSGPVLRLSSGADLDIIGVTIENGYDPRGEGGALLLPNDPEDSDEPSPTTVVVTSCVFVDNTAEVGGAIDNGYSNSGSLGIVQSVFLRNSALFGGAIENGGTASVTGSTFTADSARTGGAIDSGGLAVPMMDNVTGSFASLAVSGSTFYQNSATDGGAIDTFDGAEGDGDATGNAMISTSTFVSNSARDGGAVDSSDNYGVGYLTVTASTFLGNKAPRRGADIANRYNDASVVGDNEAVDVAADIFGDSCIRGSQWTDRGYNVGRDSTCFGTGTRDIEYGPRLSRLLGPLTSNGGPTATMLPLAGNPALLIIPAQTVVSFPEAPDDTDPPTPTPLRLCPATDQRGARSRPGQRCNSGSVQ